MSQNDYTIANQTTPLFRADLNNALQALASNSSGPTAPTTTYANMTWYDTAANVLYMRSEADDAWIALGTLNQTNNTFAVSGITNAAIIAGLGFTPVQQGGGAGQLTNKIFIGWSGTELKAQVDVTDQGAIALKSDVAQLAVQRYIPTTTYSFVYDPRQGPTTRSSGNITLPAGFYLVTFSISMTFLGAGTDKSYSTSYQMIHTKNGTDVVLKSETVGVGSSTQTRTFSITEQLFEFGGNDFLRTFEPDESQSEHNSTSVSISITAKGPYTNATFI